MASDTCDVAIIGGGFIGCFAAHFLRQRGASGLFHAFGFSGHGYQLAPGVGAVMADLIADGRSDKPIDAFSIRRWAPPSGSR